MQANVSLDHGALPVCLIQPIDVSQLLRELRTVEAKLDAQKIRDPEAKDQPKIKASPKMTELLEQLKLDISSPDSAKKLIAYLEGISTSSPTIHMSFCSEADQKFLTSLITWLRKEIHPKLLLIVGIDPTIGAGSILRTTNKSFNFSLASRFKLDQKLLSNKISDAIGTQAP